MNDQNNISILGAGESGVGAALLAKKHGLQVFVSDLGEIKEDYRQTLIKEEIEWEEGQHDADRILNSDLIVKSPGIPPTSEIIIQALSRGIEVISEIEFAFRYCKGKVIAITGSNGKTTTTNLVHHILQKAGKNVSIAGNIGQSFAAVLAQSDHDYYVLELSSFQLDDIVHFKPDIAIILNITPDHLDRYENSLKKYADSKFRITKNQGESDFLIYNIDDDELLEGLMRNPSPSIKIPFSLKKKQDPGAYIQENKIITNLNYNEKKKSIN